MYKEVEPTYTYPIKEDHVYAICRCSLPITYSLDLGKKVSGTTSIKFRCVKCNTEGTVYYKMTS